MGSLDQPRARRAVVGAGWVHHDHHEDGFSRGRRVEARDARAGRHGLPDGGKIEMPLQEMFWRDYFGSLTDKFGINWMFNCQNKS